MIFPPAAKQSVAITNKENPNPLRVIATPKGSKVHVLLIAALWQSLKGFYSG